MSYDRLCFPLSNNILLQINTFLMHFITTMFYILIKCFLTLDHLTPVYVVCLGSWSNIYSGFMWASGHMKSPATELSVQTASLSTLTIKQRQIWSFMGVYWWPRPLVTKKTPSYGYRDSHYKPSYGYRDSHYKPSYGYRDSHYTPSYRYRDSQYKPKTVSRPSQVYNGNPYTDKTASS